MRSDIVSNRIEKVWKRLSGWRGNFGAKFVSVGRFGAAGAVSGCAAGDESGRASTEYAAATGADHIAETDDATERNAKWWRG